MDHKSNVARKTHSGKIYNKERTKQKLLHAVGKILNTEGHRGLKVNRIAEVARVDKKLIYLYFDGVDNLIDEYLRANDFWMGMEEVTKKQPPEIIDEEMMFSIFKNQYDLFESSAAMQKIVLWELTEYNQTLRDLVDKREEFGKAIFKISDKQFKNSGVNFRAMNAIFVAAIYYIILHSKANGSTVCEIDVTKPKGKKAILNTIEQMMGWAYEKAQNSE